MFISDKNTKIFIGCPPQFASGGPELLHQLCYELNRKGIHAKMFYNCKEYFDGDPVHERFLKYNVSYVTEVEDSNENILIVPETLMDFLYKYENIRKCIWWLGINHYLIPTELHSFKYTRDIGHYILTLLRLRHPLTFRDIRRKGIMNWAQCWYAVSFLENKKIHNVAYLSDYISETFTENYSIENLNSEKKRDIVLYNPKRNIKFLNKVMKYDSKIEFIAIENMTPVRVRELMLEAKVYVDFGSHPGKDRLPREAAMQGCCILTSTLGSADFFDDVPISSEYKFERKIKNIPKIVEKIRAIFSDYENEIGKYQGYREYILSERDTFVKDIEKLFIADNQETSYEKSSIN